MRQYVKLDFVLKDIVHCFVLVKLLQEVGAEVCQVVFPENTSRKISQELRGVLLQHSKPLFFYQLTPVHNWPQLLPNFHRKNELLQPLFTKAPRHAGVTFHLNNGWGGEPLWSSLNQFTKYSSVQYVRMDLGQNHFCMY